MIPFFRRSDSLDEPKKSMNERKEDLQAMATPGELLIQKSAASTVANFVFARARQYPDRVAVEAGERSITYKEFKNRICRLANALKARGIKQGSCLAILSKNRLEYLEVVMAAAQLGAIVACQNWRLTPSELGHCLNLVQPQLIFVSERHAAKLEIVGSRDLIELGDAYEQLLSTSNPNEPEAAAEPEDPLLILYTSGTTGLPKGAIISHRAQIVRNLGDCDLPAEMMRGFAIISRCAGLVGHVYEEQQKPAMRAIWEAAEKAVTYDGLAK